MLLRPWLDPGIAAYTGGWEIIELYCCLLLIPLLLLIGLVRELAMGEVEDEDWFLSIMALRRGCSLAGLVEEVRPWPRACKGNW